MIKDKCKILLSLIITIIIIILPSMSIAEDEREGTELKGAQHLYTIEDMIFNKIPILNVNVFDESDAPEDSIAFKLREAVATWYVAFTRISIVSLGIILIYVGIRLAIATVASEKADYKKMLVNWITAIIIVFALIFVIAIVLQINDTLLQTLKEINDTSDFPIYETIRTRSKDLRFTVGIPAAIMYWALIILSISFLWVYIKRLFTVMILIVVAPFVGAKYAIDGAGKGQRSKILSTWLYEFTINVLIQPIHAILYIVLMSIAAKLATTTVLGFILALIFMNFILKADKIFMRIFNFDSRAKMSKDTANNKIDFKEQFVAAYLAKGLITDSARFTKNEFIKGSRLVKNRGKKIYYKYANQEGSRLKSAIETRNKKLNQLDRSLNDLYKKVSGKNSERLILKQLSRRKDLTGQVAKQKLKLAKKQRKQRFTAPFKFIASAGGNILMVAFSLPVAVSNPGVGLGMGLKGIKGIAGMATERDQKGNRYTKLEGLAQVATLGGYGKVKQLSSDKEKLANTVGYLNDASRIEDEIEKIFKMKFGDKSDEKMKQYKKEINYLMTYASDENMTLLLKQELEKNNIISMNEDNIDSVTEEMAEAIFKDIGIDQEYSKQTASKIKKELIADAKKSFKEKTKGLDAEKFTVEDLAKSFSGTMTNNGITGELDFDEMKKTFNRTMSNEDFSNMDVNEVERVVNRYVDDLVKDMKTQYSGIEGIDKEIKQEASLLAKKFMEQKRKEMGTSSNFQNQGKNNSNNMFGQDIEKGNEGTSDNKFANNPSVKDGIVEIVKNTIEEKGKEAGIDFGYGKLTDSILNLKKINDKAKKDVKTSVVNVSRFINNL